MNRSPLDERVALERQFWEYQEHRFKSQRLLDRAKRDCGFACLMLIGVVSLVIGSLWWGVALGILVGASIVWSVTRIRAQSAELHVLDQQIAQIETQIEQVKQRMRDPELN